MPVSVMGIGHQLLAWALGLALILALLDSREGFVRDHPPLAWRRAGGLVGPLAAAGTLAVLMTCRRWDLLALTGPFAVMAIAYSLAWLTGKPAVQRRRLGLNAAILGAISVLFLMLIAGPSGWTGGVVMGAYAASAALLGGFTVMLLGSGNDRADEVNVPFSPYGLLARAVAVGLALLALAAGELFRLRDGLSSVGPELGLWVALSLVVPLVLMAAGHKLFPRGQRWIWASAWVSALVGQAAIHSVMLGHPGLLPPVVL